MTDKIDKMRASGWKPVTEQEAFSDEVKEWARQVWTYTCGRDSKRTSAYLAVGETDGRMDQDFPPTHVSPRTIRSWAQKYDWAGKQLRELRAIHGDVFNAVNAQLVNSSVEAIRVQSELIQMAKQDAEALARGERIPQRDSRYLKVIVDLTNGVLDRAGHLPYTRKDTNEQPVAPSTNHALGMGTKSTEELMALSSMRITELIANAAREAEVIEVEPKEES